MTTTRDRTTELTPAPIVSRPFPIHAPAKGSMFGQVLRTTDHKLIGKMYLVTTFVFFMLGGMMALLMRTELARPGMQFLSPEQYNQLFTIHGTIMLLFFATPLVFAFANLVLLLQIGSPDVAFPRLNALSYWPYLFGSTTAVAGFVTPGGAADAGWTLYAPLNRQMNSPGVGTDLWIMGLAIVGLSTVLGGVNMITTVITLRCPGMTMFRMPIFCFHTVGGGAGAGHGSIEVTSWRIAAGSAGPQTFFASGTEADCALRSSLGVAHHPATHGALRRPDRHRRLSVPR